MNNTNRSTSICPPSRLHMHTRTHHAHKHIPPQMLSQPGLLAQGNDILAVSKPQHTNTQHDIAFYPWGGALKKTNPRMTKGWGGGGKSVGWIKRKMQVQQVFISFLLTFTITSLRMSYIILSATAAKKSRWNKSTQSATSATRRCLRVPQESLTDQKGLMLCSSSHSTATAEYCYY